MAKQISSDALWILNRVLGIAGPGAPVTEITDGTLEQVLDVGPIVRRSRALGDVNTGIFLSVMENVHAGSGSLFTNVDPYNVLAAAVVPPYPAIMPAEFDIWLLGMGLVQLSGTGTLGASLDYEPSTVGWGVDDSAAAVAITAGLMPIGLWDTLISAGGVNWGTLGGVGPVYTKLMMRIPRSRPPGASALIFRSTASALATFQLWLQLGVFPNALGQDGQN